MWGWVGGEKDLCRYVITAALVVALDVAGLDHREDVFLNTPLEQHLMLVFKLNFDALQEVFQQYHRVKVLRYDCPPLLCVWMSISQPKNEASEE